MRPQNVEFQARDGVNLKGWFLGNSQSPTVVILLHGVDANRTQLLGRALWLAGEGFNVLSYDARGCGESERVLRSFGWHEQADLLGALDWLKGCGFSQIGCIGFSQGAATILLASAQLPPEVKVVVAESPYRTLKESVDAHFRMLTGLPSNCLGALVVPLAERKLSLKVDDVSVIREIPKLRVPTFFVCGGADRLAPSDAVKALYEAAPVEKDFWIVEGAWHGDFFYYAPQEYRKRVGDFLRKYLL